jgi:hypothetical protein|nr:MAG TPA: hypothetical protein [Caudoviricetes sp.]
MLQVNLALQEILNFLNTTTIKYTYFSDIMQETWVQTDWKDKLPDRYKPYYRHLLGEYILKEDNVPNTAVEETGVFTYSGMSSSAARLQFWADIAPYLDGKWWVLRATGDYVQLTEENALEVCFGKIVLLYPPISNQSVYTQFDQLMYVTSLDTGDKILFSKENLHSTEINAHKKTLAAYRLPSRYYELLCEAYPSQVDLIKAIVYPVPLFTTEIEEKESRYYAANNGLSNEQMTYLNEQIRALKQKDLFHADNYALLQYDDTLLHINERGSLLERLRTFLDLVKVRYDVPRYAFEECYPLAFWGVLWSQMVLQLLAQRQANIRTPFAHPYHIWEYLESHGLRNYRGILSTTQEMFLYRNLRYILANRGKHRILNILIENILNESGIEAVTKSAVLDCSNAHDNDYVSTPKILTEPLDSDQIVSLPSSTESISEILSKEYREGLEPELNDDVLKEQEDILSHLGTTYLPTKLIELSRTQFNPRFYDLFCAFVTQTLIAMCCFKREDGIQDVTQRLQYNDVTYRFTVDSNGTELVMSMGDMIALLYFTTLCELRDPRVVDEDGNLLAEYDLPIPNSSCLYVPFKFQKPEIPKKVTWHPYHRNPPAVDEDYIETYNINWFFDPEELMKDYISIDSIHSQEEVADYIQTMFTMMKHHQTIAAGTGDLLTNKSIHTIYRAVLDPGIVKYQLLDDVSVTTYKDWFGRNKTLGTYIRAMQLQENFSEAAASLGTVLINQLLSGIDLKYARVNIDDVTYKKLKQLVIKLCSYNIAFMDTATQSNLSCTTVPIMLGHHELQIEETTRQYVTRCRNRLQDHEYEHTTMLRMSTNFPRYEETIE